MTSITVYCDGRPHAPREREVERFTYRLGDKPIPFNPAEFDPILFVNGGRWCGTRAPMGQLDDEGSPLLRWILECRHCGAKAPRLALSDGKLQTTMRLVVETGESRVSIAGLAAILQEQSRTER